MDDYRHFIYLELFLVLQFLHFHLEYSVIRRLCLRTHYIDLLLALDFHLLPKLRKLFFRGTDPVRILVAGQLRVVERFDMLV